MSNMRLSNGTLIAPRLSRQCESVLKRLKILGWYRGVKAVRAGIYK